MTSVCTGGGAWVTTMVPPEVLAVGVTTTWAGCCWTTTGCVLPTGLAGGGAETTWESGSEAQPAKMASAPAASAGIVVRRTRPEKPAWGSEFEFMRTLTGFSSPWFGRHWTFFPIFLGHHLLPP